MKVPTLYIIVPCYNEEAILPSTHRLLSDKLTQLTSTGKISSESRIMFVDDGSTDQTWNLIKEYHDLNPAVCGIKLSHNFGHQYALLSGMETSCKKVDAIISIDADLQDDIGVMAEMLEKYEAGADVVYGVRKNRSSDTFLKRFTAQFFYKMMKKMGVDTIYNHADYRLMSHRALKAMLKYRERNLYLRGIVPLLGYPNAQVYYDRKERLAGESKYPLKRMLHLAMDGITSLSAYPLHLLLMMGFLFLVVAIIIFIYVIYRFAIGEVVPGWASLMLSIWFVGGCILLGLGTVGEYIGKIYIEVKGRPRYEIEEELP